MSYNKQSGDVVDTFLTVNVPNDVREGVYVISVAARLANLHPNTLRKYERAGILRPVRTSGRHRLYSAEDVGRLRLMRLLCERYNLTVDGLNLVTELVELVRMVINTVEDDGALSRHPAARDMANQLRKRLRSI